MGADGKNDETVFGGIEMFKLALCQIAGSPDKDRNIAKAEKFIRDAAAEGAQVISLPEMWNCPYSNDYFRKFAEAEDGKCVKFMSDLSGELGIYLIGGTIAELADGNVYNTCYCFDKKGDIIGKHRKVHLFDVDLEGKLRFMESDTLTAGNEITVIDTEYCRIGIAICYDVRFPEMFRTMTLDGAKLIMVPAAFSSSTGPFHWDLLMRSRAVDNQVYIGANAPARAEKGIFNPHGCSCIVDPWAEIIAQADKKECIIYGDIDLEYEDKIRQQLPVLKHLRPEMY